MKITKAMRAKAQEIARDHGFDPCYPYFTRCVGAIIKAWKNGPLCKYGDPFCPCQDGDTCHYEGVNRMKPPRRKR